ncbi:hypothetical protein HS067_02940 [Mannheimia haemolytica]
MQIFERFYGGLEAILIGEQAVVFVEILQIANKNDRLLSMMCDGVD